MIAVAGRAVKQMCWPSCNINISMNVFFAATGLIIGMVGAATALHWQGNSTSTQGPKIGGGSTLINHYQMYLFISEFLRLSGRTKPSASQELSHFEFYRIIFKIIKPVVDVSDAGVL